MKRSRFALIVLSTLVVFAMTASPLMAVTVPFDPRPSDGSKSGGTGEVAPRGFGVEVVGGAPVLNWLSSEYDNNGFAPIHVGEANGLDRLPLTNTDGTPFVFKAYVDKNPAQPMIAIYENGVLVSADRYTLETPVRDVPDPSGNDNRWGVPITGLELFPGSLYEFAFLRGITANNGMTGVISADGTGYIQSPAEGAELDHYTAHRADEYQYRQYSQIYDLANGSYATYVDNPAYDPATQTFVAMRFSFTTAADLTALDALLPEAVELLEGITDAMIAAGEYDRTDVDALGALIDEIDATPGLSDMRQSEIEALVGEVEAAIAALTAQPVEPSTPSTPTIVPSDPATPTVGPTTPKTETVVVPASSNPKTGDAIPIAALILASVGFGTLPTSVALRGRKRV